MCYNFLNYSILAGLVYVVCLILSSFKEENVSKRTIVSSMNYKSYHRRLLVSNILLAIVLDVIYILLSFLLVGEVMFTAHGMIYMLNLFVFTICAVTIAFLIGNVIRQKNAINGIVNVIALGSSFLCGAFVPMEWLPDTVLKIAHILPSYYYIKNNEIIKGLEQINKDTIGPILLNMGIVLLFAIAFVIITNVIAKRKRTK